MDVGCTGLSGRGLSKHRERKRKKARRGDSRERNRQRKGEGQKNWDGEEVRVRWRECGVHKMR